MSIGDHELNNNCLNIYDPLPSLPPRGKEHNVKPFPFGGNGKGGKMQ
jgi:hypothetical protein